MRHSTCRGYTIRERCYIENGARLLKELISSCDGKENPIWMFLEEELKKGTNNYDDAHILVEGRMYTAYKGTHEGRPIVVRRLNFVYGELINNAFNEVVMLSQINHKNVVKLLGCCIETPDPRPVYEFISNGNLYQHLPSGHLSWESCLRIATEVACAVNYLHSRDSKPIIHRDIRSLNILLDEHYTAKLTNFGKSATVVLSETNSGLDTMGTNKQMDALYLSRYDVHDFGMVLVDLLTANVPRSILNGDDVGVPGWVEHFISCIQKNRLLVAEGKQDEIYQWMACAELAERCFQCIRYNEGPTMKEVVIELTRIRALKQCMQLETP
ncbi:hypothetical protein AAC387_Pa03g4631 [Persea americana]